MSCDVFLDFQIRFDFVGSLYCKMCIVWNVFFKVCKVVWFDEFFKICNGDLFI